MARVKDPDYVTGRIGNFHVQPRIVHPAYCACHYCATNRDARGDAWDTPVIYRTIKRKSIYPDSRVQSAAYALQVKAQVEQELQAAVAAREAMRNARPHRMSLRQLADRYSAAQAVAEKRIDRTQHVINVLVRQFGADVDPAAITRRDYDAFTVWLVNERKVKPATIKRYTNVLLAMINYAVDNELITEHQLTKVKRIQMKPSGSPVTFTDLQIAVLLGPAMEDFEAEQEASIAAYDPTTKQHPPSRVPLRGICLVALFTFMRPENNFGLMWEQLMIDTKKNTGTFTLTKHKNDDKLGDVTGPLHPDLVRYLRTIYPGVGAHGFVHPNPMTGKPYRNIRKQWFRLIEFANRYLPAEQQITGVRRHFYLFRHTGASHLARHTGDPVLVTKMMADSSLTTVMKHYFDSAVDHMQRMVATWQPVQRGKFFERKNERTSAQGTRKSALNPWNGGGSAYGIRTRVTAVRGRRPGPLDECAGQVRGTRKIPKVTRAVKGS